MEVEEGFYAYAVVLADRETLPDLPSLGESGPELAFVGDIGVVGEWIDVSRPLGTRKQLVAHTDMINALAETGPVLPMQFGTVLVDDGPAVEELVGTRGTELRQGLEAVRDRQQFVLRARYDLDVVLAELVEEDSRIADLRRRTHDLAEHEGQREKVRLGELVSAAMERRRDYDADWLQQQVAPHVERLAIREVAGMDALAEMAVALRTEQMTDFENLAEALAEEAHPWARLSLVGPMALYDFVAGG